MSVCVHVHLQFGLYLYCNFILHNRNGSDLFLFNVDQPNHQVELVLELK